MEPVEFDGLLAIRALGHHGHIRDSVDESDETLTDDRLVVNHHDFDLSVIHSLWSANSIRHVGTNPTVREGSLHAAIHEPSLMVGLVPRFCQGALDTPPGFLFLSTYSKN